MTMPVMPKQLINEMALPLLKTLKLDEAVEFITRIEHDIPQDDVLKATEVRVIQAATAMNAIHSKREEIHMIMRVNARVGSKLQHRIMALMYEIQKFIDAVEKDIR